MDAPLRIRAPDSRPAARGARRSEQTSSDTRSVDSYVQRLIKLIPAEVVTAYLVGRQIAVAHDYDGQWALWCLLATLVFRSIMTFERPDGVDAKWKAYLYGIEWPAVLIAAISFSIWIFSLGDQYPPILPSLEQWQATLVLLLWTPFAPLVYKGAAPKQPTDAQETRPGTVVAQLTARKSRKGPSAEVADPFADIRVPAATEPRLAPRLPAAIRRDRIGREDRKPVPDTTVPPYNQIVLLHAFAQDGRLARKMGTGWFLTPRLVLTAAHVVYDPAVFGQDGTAVRVLGWPGYGSAGSSSSSFESSDVHVHPQFERHLRQDFDIALIALARSYDGLGIPLAGAGTQNISVAGYPGDLGNGRTMFDCVGTVVGIEQGFIFHDADTSGGQSGAPIIAKDGAQGAIGIHIDGKDRSDHLVREANLGLIFHPEIQDWLKKF